jgi:hypothetical protein
MSNIFKSNNRFSVLNEDFSENTTKNKKRNEIVNSKYEKYNNNNNNKNNKNELKEKTKIIKEQNLSIENFPMLPPKENILESKKMNISMNYLEKMKTSIDSEKNDLIVLETEYENLEPGCLLIKRDPLTNKIIHKYKNGNYTNEKYLEKDSSNELSNDLINNNCIINTLVELYEKRTEEYIQLWGYDEWEKMFRFPNHDYEYFDKLHELLEEEELLEQEIAVEEENY